MVAYPYQGRDLFSTPEKYHYAPSASRHFFSDWSSYLRDVCADLPAPAPPSLEPNGSPKDLATKLSQLLRQPSSEDLLPLVHRFEVFRRLWSAYEPDHRKTKDASPAQPTEYILFGHVLLAHYTADGNLQWISTLLKLGDAILSVRPDIPPDALPALHQLLLELGILLEGLS